MLAEFTFTIFTILPVFLLPDIDPGIDMLPSTTITHATSQHLRKYRITKVWNDISQMTLQLVNHDKTWTAFFCHVVPLFTFNVNRSNLPCCNSCNKWLWLVEHLAFKGPRITKSLYKKKTTRFSVWMYVQYVCNLYILALVENDCGF